MKNNKQEKNIKDQLENYENFDGDKMAMWDAIEQELDKKKKRGFFWIWLGTGVSVIGLVSMFLFFGDNNSSHLSHFKKPESKEIKDSISNNLIANHKKALSNTTINLENLDSNNKSSTNQIAQKEQKTIKNATTFTSTKKTTSPLNETLNLTIENNITVTKSIDQEVKTIKSSTYSNKKEIINFLPPLYSELDPKKIDIFNLELDTLLNPNNDDNKDNEKIWALNFSGGLLANTTGYSNSSTYSSSLKKSNSSELGWSFQAEVERLLQKDFYLSSGIDFSRHWIEFNYTSKTTETKNLENVIIRFDLDLVVGDTTFYYGDTSVISITERKVKHHNQYDKLKIPILLGKRWAKEKFSYGVFAGVGIDIWLQQKGRNLSHNSTELIYTYDSKKDINSINGGFRKLGISTDFKGVANYSIGKNSSLFLQSKISYSLIDWSPINNGIKQKPITFGVNVGYQIKF